MNTAVRGRLLILLYCGFVSLGLPDTVLGVAWPKMRLSFNAPLEAAGLRIGAKYKVTIPRMSRP